MSTKTKIEWCDATVNPIVGCSKCSPGCDNCYAEKRAYRLSRNELTAKKYAGVVDERGKWTGRLNWTGLDCFNNLSKKPSRIFIGSMTDMFHPNLDDNQGQGMRDMISALWHHPQHTFMFLTKRPERMKADIEWLIAQDGDLPGNLWLGVTVCNQAEADTKIPLLLQTPAAKRFVSVEPMLGPVSLSKYLETSRRVYHGDDLSGFIDYEYLLHWVICGGESGPGARPTHPDWVRNLRDQCEEASVPFFFKSWGEWLHRSQSSGKPIGLFRSRFIGPGGVSKKRGLPEDQFFKAGKKHAGRLLDGVEYSEFPEAQP